MRNLVLIHGAGFLGKWLMKRFRAKLINKGYSKDKITLLNPNIDTDKLLKIVMGLDMPHVLGHSYGGIKADSALRQILTPVVDKLFIIDSKTLRKTVPTGAKQTYNYWCRRFTILGRNLGDYYPPAINKRLPWKNHFNILSHISEVVLWYVS